MYCYLHHTQRDKHAVPVRIRMCVHQYDELTYYITGQGTTQIGDTIYPYKAGTFAYYRAGTQHDEIDPEPCDVIWSHFRFRIEGLDLQEGVFEDPHGELIAALRRMRREAMNTDSHREAMVHGCLAQVIVMAARLMESPSFERTFTDWQEVIDYVDENSNQPIDFSELAGRYHYSYDRFRHLFREKFGLSPHSYLMRQRIANASVMLTNTNMKMTAIAYACGFSSSSQFSNIFRRHTGMTPGEYQRQNKGT